MPDAHFQGLVKLTDWSRLTSHDRYHCRSTRPFNALSLSLEAMPLPRSNFFPDTEVYRQIIYPGYIPYKVNSKK